MADSISDLSIAKLTSRLGISSKRLRNLFPQIYIVTWRPHTDNDSVRQLGVGCCASAEP